MHECSSSADDGYVGNGDSQNEASSSSGRSSDEETDWARRVTRQASCWDARRAAMKEEFIQQSAQLAGINRKQVESLMQQLQQRVDDAWTHHACCRSNYFALGCGLVERHAVRASYMRFRIYHPYTVMQLLPAAICT